jgi:NAD-dependent deacetylase
MLSNTIQDRCRQVAGWLAAAQRAVIFTGAGMSTASGIPDFRSPGGIWFKFQPVYFDDFLASAAARQEYWRQKSLAHREFADSLPNRGHEIIARWQQIGRVRGVVTQNIDGLHQLAGSRGVLELHGTAREVVCLDCAARFDPEPLIAQFLATDVVPPCPHCGGLLKSATISFGQALPVDVLETAAQWSNESDLFLTLGSSLVVEPAASLPRAARERGARLVIVNRDPTGQDRLADAVINADLVESLEEIDRSLAITDC